LDAINPLKKNYNFFYFVHFLNNWILVHVWTDFGMVLLQKSFPKRSENQKKKIYYFIIFVQFLFRKFSFVIDLNKN
jgi:hypothetical protein